MRKLFSVLILTTSMNVAMASGEDFAPISTRSIPVEVQQQLQSDRSVAMEEEQGQASLFNKQGQVYVVDDYYMASPAQHIATYFSPDRRIVELEDESQWIVLVRDVPRAANWLSNDPIAIYPNKDFFWKSTAYKLTNLAINESVDVDLIRGPKLNSIYTKYVMGVDTFNDSIYLNDGTRWDISWSDSTLMYHWMPNDVVIVGDNYGWSSSSYPSILINVSLNQYVTARRGF